MAQECELGDLKEKAVNGPNGGSDNATTQNDFCQATCDPEIGQSLGQLSEDTLKSSLTKLFNGSKENPATNCFLLKTYLRQQYCQNEINDEQSKLILGQQKYF